VRPNIETGIGYAIGVEFLRLASGDRSRLLEFFPRGSSYDSDTLPDLRLRARPTPAPPMLPR